MIAPLLFNCHLICYDDFGPGEICVSVKCGHVLHSKCMNEWIIKQNTCPYCSTPTSLNDIIQIHFDDTVSDFFSDYYKGKCENLCKQIEKEKNRINITPMTYSSFTTKDIIDGLNFEALRERNKKITNLLYCKFMKESNLIDQERLQDMIDTEIVSKTEQIKLLKHKIVQEQEKSNSKIKELLHRAKLRQLEDKIKYEKEEKTRSLQQMAHLQVKCNKLTNDNEILRGKCLTMGICQELKNKIKNQTEIINNLMEKNECLKRQKQNFQHVIDKINEKTDQRYRGLYVKYQDLKTNSESMESESEAFEKKEKEFYKFHRNIITLASKLIPIDNKTNESFKLFMKENGSFNCDLWKKASNNIFNVYKNLTKIMEMEMIMHQNASKEHTEMLQKNSA